MFYLTATTLILSIFKLICGAQPLLQLTSKDREVFFNKTSYIRIPALNFPNHIGLNFRTCTGGSLFVQNSQKSRISLNVTVEGLLLSISIPPKVFDTKISGHFLDNSWHKVYFVIRSTNITLTVADRPQVVANASFNAELMNPELTLSDGSSRLTVGEGFFGCIIEGPSLIFNASVNEKYNVVWGMCPLPTGPCSPCKKAGNPCQNNAKCEEDKLGNYECICEPGFTGVPPNCTEITSCANAPCLHGGICTSSVTNSSYNCTCPAGFTGKLCHERIDQCKSYPCQNNATCMNIASGYVCNCPDGFTGHNCESDIDECKGNICKHGHCLNSHGSYQCFCIPGFTGDHCEHDVDECLSHPCFNGATCKNEINRYVCVCPPGFTGRDCRIDIDECDSNPCSYGGTCINGNASFTCECIAGLTGDVCEVNIDDCESSPCLNNGTCKDLINQFSCDCNGTGFAGERCEINIDDCGGNPCQNNGTCKDAVNDYYCDCFPGYSGKNCEIDINECESNPCQSGGTCLEKSNLTLYANNKLELPPYYTHDFNYANAYGYECICIPGVTGFNCEIDIKECDSNPCKNGATCKEEIGRYTCECSNGYEGAHCEVEISECDRYKPCVHGHCHEPRPAYYECSCYDVSGKKYGGKNCSVELIGCNQEPACLNNGTCIPYVVGETEHRFNCTCPSGFHGPICEKVTTMSLGGDAYVVVNTTREEGYDISFRFKTTLPSGLLALGRGSTYYILELINSRLNLHSSLLNKWEGVYVGSQLNDSKWQKVFVAMNSSHVVLAANEEQTIYPISLSDGATANWTSFTTTYVGGTSTNLKHLMHGPSVFIGCTENIVVNEQWVIPGEHDLPIDMVNVEVGCQRRDQCSRNPCHSGGQCTDLWKTFSCTCQRPYLGNQCQYNFTAATFGHENITNSLVTVSIANHSKKAVRNIVDISMFIRTRQTRGAIFYMGSYPGVISYTDETHIAAKLDSGELFVKFQFNGTPESYAVGGVKLNDGYNHLIQVIRNVTLVQVKINSTEYFRKTIGASGPLDAQVLYLGGFPVQRNENDTTLESSAADLHRSNRDASLNIDSMPNDPNILRLVRQAADKFENIPNFKGVIQDVQISNGSSIMVVEFFPLNATNLIMPKVFGNVSFDNNTILEGVVSDDTCASNPCANGAACSVTWNDYECHCPVGYKGKQCKEMEFCQLKDCPLDSKCQNLQFGYECVSNITMNGAISNTSLQYTLIHKGDTTVSLNSIEITYRSKTGGTLLYLCNNEDMNPHKHLYFFIFVYNDVVTVAWKLDPNAVEQFQRIKKERFDGEWTSIIIKMNDNKVQGGFVSVDEPGQYFSLSNFSSFTWSNLITSGKIYIGGGDNFLQETLLSEKHSYIFDGESTNVVDSVSENVSSTSHVSILQSLSNHTQNGIFYKGCIGEVRIGGILLPYFTEKELNNTGHEELSYFILKETILESAVGHGCYLCFETDCKNGGWCWNKTVNYSCSCLPGFDGDDCSVDINECVNNKCNHGASCVDEIANYTCRCTTGWSGWLCDVDIDECLSKPCLNNGTCIDYLGYYKCSCTDEFIGKQCEIVKEVTCENKPCKNGAHCFDTPNKSTGDNFTCTCSDGFIGTYCDEKFCSVTPCRNNGLCTMKNKEPVCECSRGFRGKYCDENINDCVPNKDGLLPCLHGGRCIDGIARYMCNCSSTGYKGEHCELDIDECAEASGLCGKNGSCKNEDGSYKCVCFPTYCGHRCDLYDPCENNPCENGGTCQEKCTDEPNYECICPPNYEGKNCTELRLTTADSVVNIAKIVVPILCILLLGLVVSIIMFFMMARNKRATRGTYSPSSQEYCNPRVELDNVMKPPPEERLI